MGQSSCSHNSFCPIEILKCDKYLKYPANESDRGIVLSNLLFIKFITDI